MKASNLYIPANALLLAWIAGLTEGLSHATTLKPRHTGRSPLATYVDATAVLLQ